MQQEKSITFNHIHKRFMVLYHLSDMRRVWKKVRSDWKKDYQTDLPKRFKKYPEIWEELNIWTEHKIEDFVKHGGEDVVYYNKADLKERGWDEKLIQLLYPKPDKNINLGRGRHAYYYSGTRLNELEDSEPFIAYIAEKLERAERRKSSKSRGQRHSERFGSEYM